MSHFAHLKLLTKSDAAEILGVCTKTVDNYIRDGLLPSPKPLGGREYWHPQAFERFLAQYFGLTGDQAGHAGVEGKVSSEPAKAQPERRARQPASPKRSPVARQEMRQASLLRDLNA